MSMQTAYYPQSYAAPMGTIGGGGAGVLPTPLLPSYPSTPPGMTQLPNMPQPYFNSAALPATGALSPIFPEIPPPWQVVNGTPYVLAQSIPISSPPPVPNLGIPPDVPPPQLVAPWAFFQRPPMQPTYPPYPGMNGLNGLNGMNGMGPGQQPPMPPQQPQQPPPQPPAQAKGPSSAGLDQVGLDDTTIRSLNDQLNDPDENIRAAAVMTLYKILEGNPNLAGNPNYSDIIDAYMEKIMKDPSTLVRGGGELILRMGLIPDPKDPVRKRLTELTKTANGLAGESDVAGGLLGDLKAGVLQRRIKPPAETPTKNEQTPPAPPAGATDAQQRGFPPQQPMPIPGNAPPGGEQSPPMPGYGMSPPNGYGGPPTFPMQAGPGAMPPGGGYMPQAGGLPYNGSRLNIMSPQQQMIPMAAAGGPGYPQFGQRLNIQEGY